MRTSFQSALSQIEKDSAPSTIYESDDNKAERLYKVGIELEQNGKVYDALEYYRRAVQLVPDIEFRIYEISKRQFHSSNGNSENINSMKNNFPKVPDKNGNDEMENLDGVNLAQRFKNQLGLNLISSSLKANVVSTQSTQISDLPTEIIFYILKWIISNQLDLVSLEQVSATCKGLYLCARDEDLWKQICIK